MKTNDLTRTQLSFLVLLRWLIGWHILYEGLVKVTNPAWSAKGFLAGSDGLLSGFFHSIAENESLLRFADYLNMWGLVIIGICLLLGVFSSLFAVAGAVLLFMYYLAYPPMFAESPVPVEGNYLFVNKTLIEACALVVLALFPTHQRIGIQRFFTKKKV
jgi:thiosulfate dehydrogenase [quinone] large subunit